MAFADRSRAARPGQDSAGAATVAAGGVGKTTLVERQLQMSGGDPATGAITLQDLTRASDAVLHGRSCEDVGPLMMKLSPEGRRGENGLYAKLQRHLPAAVWRIHPLAADLHSRPVIDYLDDLFAWAKETHDGELARRCLEARYGLDPKTGYRLKDLNEIADLYVRLAHLDSTAIAAITAATKPIDDVQHRQPGHPLEEVLHGLELLRSHLGTGIDVEKHVDPDGPASAGMRTIRVGLKLPDQMSWVTDTSARSPLLDFFTSVQRHNQRLTSPGHPRSQPIQIDLLLNPEMKKYGMGFAQLNEQHTIGVSRSDDPRGEAPLTKIEAFRQKARYMLRRQATNNRHGSRIEDHTDLRELAIRVDRFVAEHDRLAPDTLAAGMKELEQAVLAATVHKPAELAADRKDWDATYADVGRRFGADCKRVRAALQSYFGIIHVIELGNEPQSEWVVPDAGGFPGTAKGRGDMIDQFIKTTDAALAALGPSPANGPTVLNAAPQWDPATEDHILREMRGGGGDLVGKIASSPFRDRVMRYVNLWRRHNANATTVPLAIHVYNSPALDRALIEFLANLAGGRYALDGRGDKIHLDLYVTEFQVDVDAGAGADGSADAARQTTGLVAAGTNVELAAAAHRAQLTIKSMLAWSYTSVNKPGKNYKLDTDPSLKPLFG